MSSPCKNILGRFYALLWQSIHGFFHQIYFASEKLWPKSERRVRSFWKLKILLFLSQGKVRENLTLLDWLWIWSKGEQTNIWLKQLLLFSECPLKCLKIKPKIWKFQFWAFLKNPNLERICSPYYLILAKSMQKQNIFWLIVIDIYLVIMTNNLEQPNFLWFIGTKVL